MNEEHQRLDEIIHSLSALPHGPILLDERNRERVRAVLARLHDPTVLATMTAVLHGLVRQNLPLTPLLLACNQLLAVEREDLLHDFLDLFTSLRNDNRACFQFLGMVLRLLDRSSDALAPWLLLTRLYLREAGSTDRLLRLQEICCGGLNRHAGDPASRILHLATQFSSAGYPARLIMDFVIDAGELGLSPERFFQAMDVFFPLPLQADDLDPTWRIRRLSGRDLFLAVDEHLLAIPLDLYDGMLPPGCLKWFDEEGKLLQAGYLFPGRKLSRERQNLILECENFSGEAWRRQIRVTRSRNVGIHESHFYSHPVKTDSFSSDPLSLFFGYIEARMSSVDDAAGSGAGEPLRAAAQAAYGALPRFEDIARQIRGPEERTVDQEPTRGFRMTIY